MSLLQEVLVVEKRRRLTKDLHIRTQRVETRTQQDVATTRSTWSGCQPNAEPSRGMAKTLVGLYETLTDAEHVVHALGMQGFPRGGIRLAAPHSTARHGTGASVGEWITAESTTDMEGTLIDLGVPADEAHVYDEGIRRGGALVIVESRMSGPTGAWRLCTSGQRWIWTSARRTGGRRDGQAQRPTLGPPAAAPAANVRPEARQERPRTGTQGEHEEEVTMPVVEEELSVGKREVRARPGPRPQPSGGAAG